LKNDNPEAKSLNDMINSHGVSEQLESLYAAYKGVAAEVYPLIAESGTDAVLLRDVNLFDEFPPGTLCYVKEGYLKLMRGNREIRMFSSGDFIPPTGNWTDAYSIASDFRSDLVTFSMSHLLQRLGADDNLRDRWAVMCEHEHRLHLCLCGEYAPEMLEFEMVVRNFSKGDVIGYPDENSDSVYEMISGKANVFLNDVQVGTIGANEMFGDMSFLVPDGHRLKVVAAKNCFVRILEPRVFAHLLETNNQFAVTLARNLAVRLNTMYGAIAAMRPTDSE
jgi:CRP-like cAMP-binding protein